MKPCHLIPSIFLAAFLTVSVSLRGQAAGDSIFNVPDVHDLRFEFSQPGFWDSLTTYYLDGNEQMLRCTAILDGDTIDSVGVRLKGNSSYYHPNDKKSMIVDFNEWVSGQKWHGVKKILLNNNWSDPTMMREKLTYDVCNKIGIAAPRSTYGNVYLNGSAWGLYSIVEGVDKTYLSTRFPENDGNLFKAVDAFGGGPGGSLPVSDLKWYGFTQADYYDHYELKTNDSINDWSDLMRLIDTLSMAADISTALPQVLDLDDYYSHLAVDILFANLDAYPNSARNYYLYHNLITDQFEWIHWDANMSFGRYTGGIGSSGMTTLSVTYVSSSTNRPLIGKIYANAATKAAYLDRLCELQRDYFNSTYLDAQIDSISTAIQTHVYADTRKEYSNSQWLTNLTSNITVSGPGGGTTILGLKSFVSARSTSVTSQLSALGVSCALASVHPASQEEIFAAVYPNPFEQSLTLEKYSGSGTWTYTVTDMLGHQVAVGGLSAGALTQEIDLSKLPGGMYLLTLSGENAARESIRIQKL